ncbi:hypothetical protein Tco_0622812 [Tanacetum coccineum]
MEKATEKNNASRKLDASMVRDIDGKMVGKDGKPLRTAIRMPTVSNPKFGPPMNKNHKPNEAKTNEDNPIIKETQEGEPKSVLENVQVNLTGWDNDDNSGIKSFANVVSASKLTSKLNFRTLFNEDKVEETDFVLPLAAVEVVKHKFDNTLVGFFVGQKVAFPFVKNYIMNTWSKFGVLQQGSWMIRNTPLILNKWTPNFSLAKDEVTKVPVWVKFHRVPVVAYSKDGLSLIASQVGTPIMLDAFTSAMCDEPWERIGFARALIEVSAEKDLKENVIMAVPLENGEGYSKENIRVEYGWKPPTCSKGHVNNQKKHAMGFKVGNNQNLQYQPVKSKSSGSKSNNNHQVNGIKLKNLFEKLNDITVPVTESSGGMMLKTYLEIPLRLHNSRKILTVSIAAWNIRGLNRTPKQSEVRRVVSENQLSACAILESHVDISLLSDVCSRVFKSWEWTSNANLCTKGCRIILGWNIDVVNIMVLSQSNQAMHVKIIHKATSKIMFCSFIYAGNLPAERRLLWAELDLHKHVVRGFPWTLMGDFNVALNLEL